MTKSSSPSARSNDAPARWRLGRVRSGRDRVIDLRDRRTPARRSDRDRARRSRRARADRNVASRARPIVASRRARRARCAADRNPADSAATWRPRCVEPYRSCAARRRGSAHRDLARPHDHARHPGHVGRADFFRRSARARDRRAARRDVGSRPLSTRRAHRALVRAMRARWSGTSVVRHLRALRRICQHGWSAAADAAAQQQPNRLSDGRRNRVVDRARHVPATEISGYAPRGSGARLRARSRA